MQSTKVILFLHGYVISRLQGSLLNGYGISSLHAVDQGIVITFDGYIISSFYAIDTGIVHFDGYVISSLPAVDQDITIFDGWISNIYSIRI